MKRYVLSVLVAVAASFTFALADVDVGETFDYFANNWNVVGLKDYKRGARVMPDNRIMLDGKELVQVRFGRTGTPLSRRQEKRAMEGWMPIMEIAAADGPVHYELTYWATPMPDVKDWAEAFDWPTEGENFLVWVHYKATNRSDKPAEAKIEIKQSTDPAPGNCSIAKELAPGGTIEGAGRFAFFPVKEAVAAALEKEDYRVWLQRTIDYWRGLEKSAASIHVPCRKSTNALMAAHVCQLIANDHGEVHGGKGFYDEFYIRDGAYQVMELEEAGLWDAAKKSVELYLPRQRADGRFESQANQWDADGQAIWTLWHYYQITRDRAFLERVYPHIVRAAQWTQRARRQAPADSPFAGLLPAAPADGEHLWDGKHHIVGYDLWNLRGLLCVADAAHVLGKADEEKEWRAEAQDYRAAIAAALQRTGLTYFPPTWEKAGTHWGNTETLWPTELFDRDDPRVTALIHHVRHEFGGGFIEGTIQWRGGKNKDVIHPYMSAYTTMADLARGRDEQVVEDFYWYLLHATVANAFPEGIYYKKREAWNNTIPHVTGACNYAIMLRHMLVHESGDELHLLTAVPDWWLGDGQEIRIDRLPTHFGEMNLVVRGSAKGVEVKLAPPTRNPPKRIVLRLPESRPLLTPVRGVEVVSRANQKRRWDFPTVVALYEKSNPPEVCPTPDSLSLTTGKPASCSSALPGHPAGLANDGFASSADSHWATDVNRLNDPTPWWQVDLEQAVKVARVIVVCYYGDNRQYGFTVQGSTDGKAWSMLADRRDNTAPSTRDGYECKFAASEIRYLRVTLTSNSANTGRHLVEVMAYEK